MLFNRALKKIADIQPKGVSMSESGLQALRQEHDDFYAEFYGNILPQKTLDSLWHHTRAEMLKDDKCLDGVLDGFRERWKNAHPETVKEGNQIMIPLAVLDLTFNWNDLSPEQRTS